MRRSPQTPSLPNRINNLQTMITLRQFEILTAGYPAFLGTRRNGCVRSVMGGFSACGIKSHLPLSCLSMWNAETPFVSLKRFGNFFRNRSTGLKGQVFTVSPTTRRDSALLELSRVGLSVRLTHHCPVFGFLPKSFHLFGTQPITPVSSVSQDASAKVLASVVSDQKFFSLKSRSIVGKFLNQDPFNGGTSFAECTTVVALADIVRCAIFAKPEVSVEAHPYQYCDLGDF